MIPADEYEYLAKKVKYIDGVLIWIDCVKASLNGTKAGRPDVNGYLRIHGRSNRMIAVHRLVYYLHHKTIPKIVDHIDGNVSNNRIENLRAATFLGNAQNAKTPVTNTSGRKGVYFVKASKKWQASIRADGKLKYLGIFNSFEEAVSARELGEKLHHGEFSRH